MPPSRFSCTIDASRRNVLSGGWISGRSSQSVALGAERFFGVHTKLRAFWAQRQLFDMLRRGGVKDLASHAGWLA